MPADSAESEYPAEAALLRGARPLGEGSPVIGKYWRGLSFETKSTLAVLAVVLVVMTAGMLALVVVRMLLGSPTA